MPAGLLCGGGVSFGGREGGEVGWGMGDGGRGKREAGGEAGGMGSLRRAVGRGWWVEQLGAREEQLAVQFQHLVQLRRDVAADDVLDADAGRFHLTCLVFSPVVSIGGEGDVCRGRGVRGG